MSILARRDNFESSSVVTVVSTFVRSIRTGVPFAVQYSCRYCAIICTNMLFKESEFVNQ